MFISTSKDAVGLLEEWSAWLPLQGAGRNAQVPAEPGLYRIRRCEDRPVVVYIGETGRQLRGRLSQLQGVFAGEMPFADPHTAAPALWAMRDRDNCEFEAAVLPMEGDVQGRRALEALAISLHRLTTGQSPAANFGGMPAGYKKSTGNNAALVAAGKRARGGLDTQAPPVIASAPVSAPLGGDPEADCWMNWSWSRWTTASDAQPPKSAVGLYRLRLRESANLVYIGQGNIGQRIRAHLAKPSTPGHRQAEWFSGALEASWVELPGMAKVHLLEHENDLIASHVLATGRAPWAQFLG